MSASRRVSRTALIMTMGLVAALAAGPSAAQTRYEDARRFLELSPDPLARIPRLIGMGRLTLVHDHNNRLTLWDFAGHPTGILDADSVSTIQIWPATSSRSGRANSNADPSREREFLAARESRVGYELWRRNETTVYGFHGDFASLRLDRPYNDNVERRDDFQVPNVTAVLAGRMPYLESERMRYSLRLGYSREDLSGGYRSYVVNARGEYIGQQGTQVGPPNVFDAKDVTASNIMGGIGLSYALGPWLNVAIGVDQLSSNLDGANSGLRYSSGTGEDRPYHIGQASIVGRLGNAFEYGADARGWLSESKENFVFTLAGGIGQEPLAGRGRRLEREEEGSTLRTRARWFGSSIELGAAYNTNYRQVTITPPPSSDMTSFNYFRNTITHRLNADSLALPDSISLATTEGRGWEAVGGGNARAFGGLVGAEFHFGQQRLDNVRVGAAMLAKTWDVRGGFEFPLTTVLTGRLGYIYRQLDLDEFTEDNEFTGHTLSAGAGLLPSGATWSLNLGYAFEWLTPDYGDPTESRQGRQTLAAQLSWLF